MNVYDQKNRELQIYFIRHGFTKGNEEGRYVGRTDESLSETGRNKLSEIVWNATYMTPNVILVSPMKRCIETAELIFPGNIRLLKIFESVILVNLNIEITVN